MKLKKARSQKSEFRIPSPLQIRETTNHTNSTNIEKKLFVFYIRKNYIVSSFVKFVLFVVQKKLFFVING